MLNAKGSSLGTMKKITSKKKLKFEDQIFTPQISMQPLSRNIEEDDNDENLVDSKFDNTLYKSALDENLQEQEQISPEPNNIVIPQDFQPKAIADDNEDEENDKEIAKKAKFIQFAIENKQPEKIGDWNLSVITMNGKKYLVPDCFTDNAYKMMLVKYPNGVDVQKMIKFMKEKGIQELDAISDKYFYDDKKSKNWRTRDINSFFRKNSENFRIPDKRQEQQGTSLFQNKLSKDLLENWIFNKYF